ncbi:MAG: ComEC/Rec2 family competence protein, partial [Clostridia bacterium]
MNKLGDRKLINFRPVVAIALALALGVCFSITYIGVSVLKLALFLVIILVVASFEAKTDKRRKLWLTAMWLLIAFMVGIVIGLSQQFFFTKGIVASFGKIGGTVESVSYGSKKVILKDLIVNGASIIGKAEVTLDKFSNVAVGDIINAYGKIKGSEALGGEQIFTYFVSNNIKYIGECQFVEVVGKATLNLSQIIRGRVYTALVNNLEYQNAGIVMGMIFGETSMMNHTVTKAFQVTGLGHLFAVSGLNVGIFYTVCFFLLKRFNVVVKSVVTIVLVTLYVYICGMTISATRALVMVVVSIITQNLHFEIDGLTNLAFAMIISLLINPLALFSAGFALSFGAVLSLIVMRPQIARMLSFKKPSTRNNLAGLIGIQFVTLP